MDVDTSPSSSNTEIIHDSNYNAAEALAQDFEKIETYMAGINKESIEEWLEVNRPSTKYKNDGYAWVCVGRVEPDDLEPDEPDSPECDLIGLTDAWGSIQSSRKLIKKNDIFELAKKYHVTPGKWMFWTTTGYKGDHLWSLVAKGVAYGKMIAHFAKISAAETDKSSQHVVCIYNDDFMNKDEVLQSEKGIRSLGIKCQLHYKPDVFTHLGVYAKNPWGIQPIIYKSNFDIIAGQSVINGL